MEKKIFLNAVLVKVIGVPDIIEMMPILPSHLSPREPERK
jgi:hypothetical protein